MAIVLKKKDNKIKKTKEISQRKAKEKLSKKNKKKRKIERNKKKRIKKQKANYAKIKAEREKTPKPQDHKAYYRIIVTTQRKILGEVYSCMSKNRAVVIYNKIVDANKKSVRFPVQFSSRNHALIPSKHEILLMKTKESFDGEYTLLRNDYGQLVKNYANSDKMVIYKKDAYLIEEKFWVYGFHPREQRKTFNQLINEIILKGINPKSTIIAKRIMVYKNKLIIENEYGDIDIVICKCKQDSYRLYFELEKEMVKIKSIFFGGMPVRNTKKIILQKIQEKTGWNKVKIHRNSTRP